MYVIPKQPDELTVPIERLWDGSASRTRADAWLSATDQGLIFRAQGVAHDAQPRPEAPVLSRVDGLWEYDVVELFLVGADGQYVEIELGAYGHYLVLAFDAIRHRSDDFTGRGFAVTHARDMHLGTWDTSIILPWDMLPQKITRMNVFAIIDGRFLASHPVPGNEPDFHQPETYPELRMA